MGSDPTDHAGRDRPFWGKRTRPQSLEELAQRGPQEGQSRPRTFVSEVDKARKIEIDDGCEPTTVRASRHGGDFYRDGINPEVGFTGYRPPGADLVYKPHVVLRRRREPMQRINGGEIHPQTFENRQLLHDTRVPRGCIGRVSTDHGTGSGVLVGRDLVVTAAHVIPWGPLTARSSLTRTISPNPDLRRTSSRSGATHRSDRLRIGRSSKLTTHGDQLGFMGFNRLFGRSGGQSTLDDRGLPYGNWSVLPTEYIRR